MHHLPTKIQVLFDAQSYLGFKQLYYAWLTPHSWISTIEYHHPEINGKNYMAKSPRLTWQAVLHIWTLQNVHLHPSNHKQEDCSQLQAAANQFFHQAQQDPTILQDLVDSLTPDRIMTWPTWLIWTVGYQLPQPHARSQKTLQLQAWLHTQDIQCYLNPSLALTAPIPQIKIYYTPNRFTHSASLSFCAQWG